MDPFGSDKADFELCEELLYRCSWQAATFIPLKLDELDRVSESRLAWVLLQPELLVDITDSLLRQSFLHLWQSEHNPRWAITSHIWLRKPLCIIEYNTGLIQEFIGNTNIIIYFDVWTPIIVSFVNKPAKPNTAIGTHIKKSVTTKTAIFRANLSSCLAVNDDVVLFTLMNNIT